jgi:chromosome segregation protein
VELHGFKSFCDRSDMRFHGNGLAAIVGPNGCGKSNVGDAISWVLGEQSAKSLRGSNMQDVIFAGTKARKPLGMAQVTLTMVDPQARHEGGKLDEVTITRRLYRSGESEYLVNGRQARLRDIQDLFLGTGLGPESYAIIEQGRIGQILSNKPQDRRAIIEEAAGITRFKTKRRLAEAKLEAAKGNLTRVYDILEEVSRQVGSLKRQAQRAKRYEELRGELEESLKVALSGRYMALEREATRLALELNLANQEYGQLSAATEEKERKRVALQEQCFAVEGQLRESRKRLADLRVESERTRGKLESQRGQSASMDQRATRDGQEAEHLAGRASEIEAEIGNQAQAVAAFEGQLQEARAKVQAVEDQRNRLQQESRQRQQAMEQARTAVLRLLDEGNRLKNHLASADEFMSSIDRDLARSARDEEAATADLARLDTARAGTQGRIGESKGELQSLVEARKGCEGMLQERRQASQNLRRELDQARAEAGRLKAKQDSLSDVLSHHSYATGSVKQIFEAVQKGKAGNLRPVGVLADFLEAEPGFEKAVEEFLHDELEFVVVDGWPQAEGGIGLVRGSLQGRATFLLHHYEGEDSSAGRDETVRSESGVTARLTDVVKLTNGFQGHSLTMLPRLANCYLVEDHAQGQRLAPRHPHAYFVTPDGASYHGLAVTAGRKSGAGPLALKRELRELGSALAAKQHYVETLTSQLEKAEGEISELVNELERLRAEQQTREKDLHALEVEARKLQDEAQRSQQLLSVAKRELERLRDQRGKAEQGREQNRALLGQKETARGEAEARLSELQHETAVADGSLTKIQEEHAALRVELAGIEERRRGAQAAKQRAEQQHREFVQRREGLLAEIRRLWEHRARLDTENAELAARAEELLAEIVLGDGAAAKLAAEEEEARTHLTLADETLRLARADFQTVQERRQRLEVELVKAQGEMKYLDDTCQRDLHGPVAELAAGIEVIPDAATLESAQAKADEARRKIENLGPVNLQAYEEFNEAQLRYDFLAAQRQDLLDSIRDTEKAITEIDQESRKRFGDAFEVINQNFREMFQILFAGGTGEMRLTDPDNLIESGIEIVAQPPSKKLQNVLLLSGGEKALTAMALLMGIFKYQPSPFCILDEVDAPLDEPNTERLNRLILEMSKTTQFIVITHAKRTMEAAQVMYGVTMQEPGVSKLVSVKFQHPASELPGAVVAAPQTEPHLVVQ